MSRLSDEKTPLLSSQAGNANAQERQLTRPGVLNPLYSIFSTLHRISQFLPMNTLLSFRSANLQLNDASEKTFLYWVSLKLLRSLSKIPDQENTLNVIIPRYLRCYILKTIHFQSEFKNFIARSANMDEFAGQLFLSQHTEPTIEVAEKQKHFIQLCRDIGSTPESEIRFNFNREHLFDDLMFTGLMSMMCLGLGCLGLAFGIEISKHKNILGITNSIPLIAISYIISFVMFVFNAFIIKDFCVDHFPIIPADINGPKLILSTCSARLFQTIADTAQTVSVPVDWMERLSKHAKARSN